MGQYYNIVIKEKDDKNYRVYDRHVDGEYTLAKLMEHGWYINPMVNAVCEQLLNRPSHIAWVGDYANDAGCPKTLYAKAWKTKKYEMLHKTSFSLNQYCIVNHTKKLVLDCWMYLIENIRNAKDEWIVHPLPLLTAIGNGQGGGDYCGINKEQVGSWAWDVIEIVEWEKANKLKESGYKDFSVLFRE